MTSPCSILHEARDSRVVQVARHNSLGSLITLGSGYRGQLYTVCSLAAPLSPGILTTPSEHAPKLVSFYIRYSILFFSPVVSLPLVTKIMEWIWWFFSAGSISLRGNAINLGKVIVDALPNSTVGAADQLCDLDDDWWLVTTLILPSSVQLSVLHF